MHEGSKIVAGRLHRFALAVATLVAAGTIGASASAQGDEVRVVMVASTDSPVAGEEFQVQVEVRQTAGQPGLLQEPSFAPLRITGTTGVRHMQSFQQVFGQAPVIEIRTVVGYTILADQPGVFTIPPAIYRMGRRSISSEPLVLKVGGTAVAPSGAVPSATATTAGNFDNYAFLRATVDRTDPYVGQQVTYTLYLYKRVDGHVDMQRQPSTDDFWVQDLLGPHRQPPPELQVVQGQRFEVHVIRRLALFPTRAGSLEIGSAAIDIDTTSGFAIFGGNRELLTRESPVIRIDARPLPAGAPSGTIVGHVVLDARLDRNSAQTGRALALTVVVRGDGLLRDASITPPIIDGLRFEAPAVQDRVDTPNDLVGGERSFTWQVIPLRAGTFTIPPLGLSVFDPRTARLESMTSQALTFTATGAAVVDDAPVADEPDEPEDEPAEADNIRFGPAARHAEMRRRVAPFHARAWFPFALLGAPLLAVLAWTLRFTRAGLAAMRERLAARPSPKRHRRDAKRALSASDPAAFYAAVAALLHQALGDALGERTIGMTHSTLRELLQLRGDDDLAGRVVDELDAADFARFSSSGASTDEMQRTLDRADALVARISSLPRAEAKP